VLPTLALVAAVAALDESRQTGLEGRTGSARDVALDLLGGALGFGLAPWIVHRPEERGDD
ncbi:MAG: VanZ family protein, partial [Myxococcales bacterium]|nr:VanZ family protein [Myxococcales bacterium]